MRQYLAIAVFILASWQLGAGIWIHVKANLAQLLIESAWQASIEDKQPHKPWPWADTWPVARMTMNDEKLFILEGAQGNSLAFAPGHLQGTVLPGQTGISIIGGHRDTHFRFLEQTIVGQKIQIESNQGTSQYHVNKIAIRNSKSEPLSFVGNEDQLVLITCYPFDALASGGDMRYVVIAQRIESEAMDRTPRDLATR
jgi:sortase A